METPCCDLWDGVGSPLLSHPWEEVEEGQALGLAAGWTLGPSEYGAVHGVPDGILSGERHQVMTRYHSLALTPTNSVLNVTSTDSTTNEIVMAVSHPELPVYGVQYHPESAGSADGLTIFADFLGQ